MKTNIYTSFILLALFALGSCKSAKDLTFKKEDVPPSYRGHTGADTTGFTIKPLNHFFKDSLLSGLIKEAILNNNTIGIAQKNIEISKLKLMASKWKMAPELTAEIMATSNRFSDNSFNGVLTGGSFHHVENYFLQGTLSWELDIWKKIQNTKREAFASLMETNEVKNAIQTQIVSRVAISYFNLLMLDKQLSTAKENLKLREQTKKIADLKYQSGFETSLATKQVEAARLQTMGLISELESLISTYENSLSVLLGRPPSRIERNTLMDTQGIEENLTVGVPMQLLRNRPDVRGAEYNLRGANARVGISKAKLYPSITISATGGFNSIESGNLFDIPKSLFGTLTGGIIQPILNGKRLKSQYKIDLVERDISIIRFKEVLLVGVQEVSDALVKEEKLSARLKYLMEEENVWIKGITDAQLLYENGMADYLEVISAQNGLLQVQIELAKIKRDQLEASVELYRALGGGWQ